MAGLGAVSLNMFWNPSIKGSTFLQASMRGINTYATKLNKANILGGTKFGVLNRNLKSLENRLGHIRKTTAKITANPIKLDISTSRNSLSKAKKDMSDIEKSAKQTAFYSKKNADNLRNSAVMQKKNTPKRQKVHYGSVIGTAMAVAPMAIPLMSAVKVQQAVRDVEAITNPMFKKDLSLIEETAMRLGAKTEWKIEEVANAQKYLSMAGFSPKQMAKSTSGVLNLATIGNLGLSEASDIASNVQGASGFKKTELNKVVDMMSLAITSANVDVVELGEALKYALPSIKKYRKKESLPEMLALVGYLGNEGIKGGQAGRHAGIIARRLTAPTPEGRKQLSALDVSTWDGNGDMKSLPTLMAEIKQSYALKKYTNEQMASANKILFGGNAAPSANIVLGKTTTEIMAYAQEIKNSTGVAEKMATEKLNTVMGQMKILGSTINALSVTMSKKLLPHIQKFTTYMTNTIQPIQTWARENPNLSATIYGVSIALGIGALALATFGFIASGVGTALGVLASPVVAITLGISALAGAGYYLYNRFESVRNILNGVWTTLKVGFNIALTMVEPFKNMVVGIYDNFSSFALRVRNISANLWGGFSGAMSPVVGEFQVLFNDLSSGFGALYSAISPVFKSIGKGIRSFYESVKPIFGGIGTYAKNIGIDFKSVGSVIGGVFNLALAPIKMFLKAVILVLKSGTYLINNWDYLKKSAGAIWSSIVTTIKTPFVSFFAWIDKKFKMILGVVDKVKNIGGAVSDTVKNKASNLWSGTKSLFGFGDDKKEKPQLAIPKLLKSPPVNNVDYKSTLKSSSLQEINIQKLPLESVSDINTQAVNKQQTQLQNNSNSKNVTQNINQNINVTATDGKVDYEDLKEKMMRLNREMAHDDNDIAMRDVS